MRRFDRPQLIAFLRAVDRHLKAPVSIVVVGGAAACVGYGSPTKTADVDVFELRAGSAADLAGAAAAAREELGLAVSVGAAAIAELPENYEARLRPARGLVFRKLALLIPDKYDIALSKIVRGYPHDVDAIEGIHTNHPLSQKTLVGRFEAELLGIAVADPRRIKLNVAMLVTRLYGFHEGRRLAKKWGVPVPAGPGARSVSRKRAAE